VAFAAGLTGKALDSKIEELQPWNCIWDYYLMAFFESAGGVLGDEESEFTKDHSMFDAFSEGLGFAINLDNVKIGICRPISHIDNQERIHCEDGPAIIWLTGETQYWWHGVQVPAEWIEQKNTIDPKLGWSINNMEQKRCFFEIVGWVRVLEAVESTLIQEDETGKLLEASIPIDGQDPRMCRFVLVVCPTEGCKFALLVPPETTTAKQGVAGSWGLTPEEYNPIQHT
jgi:hypothetical protein